MPEEHPGLSRQVFSQQEVTEFRDRLLDWFRRQQRDLPWRRTKDPYAIWVSEIMLQQTRVVAAIPFYERFLARFPTFEALALASETDVLAAWAGLGYYYRARNLHTAAKQIHANRVFPATHDEIRALRGVGDYTAAAVASIAFDLPHAAVDGNVLRVLSRVCADETDIATGPGRKHFVQIADQLLDSARPGTFNQAMMELGATICLPANPQCLLCPVATLCRARSTGRQNSFPVSSKETKSVQEIRTVYWIERNHDLLLWQRPAESRLMPGFWELPENQQLPTAIPGRELGAFRHGITFHNYRFRVVEAVLPNELGPCEWLPLASLSSLPVSTIVKKAERAVSRQRANEKCARTEAASS
jgi:A/G-specific adenine glycosylase